VQATAEQRPFEEAMLHKMMNLAGKGIESLIAKQRAVLSNLLLRQ
jgi:ribonuclease PH